MRIDPRLQVWTIAAEIPGSRAIFENAGIDYACGGNRTLEDAAHEQGVDLERIMASIRRLVVPGSKGSWNDAPISDLLGHLRAGHHELLKNELRMIACGLIKMCAPPSQPSEDVRSLRAATTRLSDTLLRHIDREERDLFPAIEEALETSAETRVPSLKALRSRIGINVNEHGAIAAQLRTIRELRGRLEDSNELPQRDRETLESIARLEAHLHEFMFLENCILFPRAVALQKQTGIAQPVTEEVFL